MRAMENAVLQVWVRLGRVRRVRLVREERGDQNVGNLGLIVVSVGIIGLLMTKFVPGVGEIIDGVIGKLKDALGL